MSFRLPVVTLAVALLAAAAPRSRGDAEELQPLPAPAAEEQDAGEPEPRAEALAYSHGDPSDEEQFLLELMNRARADPAAEADRVFDDYGSDLVGQAVDFFRAQRPGMEWTRAENRDAFRSYPARPPLAFNARLIAAARAHSREMKAHDRQSHLLPGELPLGLRLTGAGYVWSAVAEGVYAKAKGMLFSHAAFAIDWGQGVDRATGRPSIGHRTSLMNQTGPVYAEAGVGVLVDEDPGTDAGPRLVTIDFAVPAAGARFVTGVCWSDGDGDGFYDPGEGIQGVRVESPATTSFTVSSSSGGYALPVPADAGVITVTATGESVGAQEFAVVMDGDNVKLDVRPPAVPPPPGFVVLPGAADAAIVDGVADFPVHAGVISAGDVEVEVDIDHADVSQLRLSLVAPDGTQAVLFDRGPAGGALRGAFDATLAPEQDLGVFAGRTHEGAWRLRVEDLVAGGAGTLRSWALRVRPQGTRPLAWTRSGLALERFSARSDELTLRAVVDAGGALLDTDEPVLLRLRDAADGAELLRLDVTDAATQARAGATSKLVVRAKVAGLDLPVLPARVVVELSVGGALVRETVPLTDGRFEAGAARPVSELFVVDGVTSRVDGDVRTTTVRGRALAALGDAGPLEVAVGDAIVSLPETAFVTKGRRRVARSAGPLRRFEIDTRSGAFRVKVVSRHEAVVDGVVPFGLRLGTRWFDAAVRPSVRGSSAAY